MSCWRNYSCDVLKGVDKAMVAEAFSKMGLTLNEDIKTVVASYEGRRANVDAVVCKDGQPISLGVIFDNGEDHLQILGDFWGTGFNEQKFTDELSRTYQRINVETRLTLMGYTIDELSFIEAEDGSVEFEAYATA